MFYRRIILLALIEAFHRPLTQTNCSMLLLLFCLKRGKNYYDFFPYNEGCYSFLVQYDKAKLTSQGILRASDNFEIDESHPSMLMSLHYEDRQILEELVKEVEPLHDEELFQKLDKQCPQLAFQKSEQVRVKIRPVNEIVLLPNPIATTKYLFTLGYEGITIDTYINTLLTYNISTVIDVRKNPLSRKYGFSKARFASCLKQVKIDYIHLPELGVPPALRKNLNQPDDYNALFEFYRSSILPKNHVVLEYLKALAIERRRTVVTCFEADYHFCHRHILVEYLQSDQHFKIPGDHLKPVSLEDNCKGEAIEDFSCYSLQVEQPLYVYTGES